MAETVKKPWGKLVSLNPKYPSVELYEESVAVGRACTALNITNTAISSKHFTVWREATGVGGDDSYIFFVMDTSTNGTFLNGERLEKGRKRLLENGVDISILNPKKSVEYITFTFLDLIAEQREVEQGGPQDKYEMLQVLGTGQFASVRLVADKATGERFAMKIIEKKRFNTSTKRPNALMDEVKILMAVRHPGIIYLRELFQTEKKLYIVLELVTGGELFDSIVEEKKFSEDKAREIVRQMLSAIAYLHSRGIAHRDLKPENILLAAKGSNIIKLSDFGLSRIIDEGSFMKTMCGTPQYVAPEVLCASGTGGYTPAVDLWSIGVILYVMLCGFAPFDDSDGTSQLFDKCDIKKGEFVFLSPYWDTISDSAKDLIRGLLTVDPKTRLTADQALAHQWVAAGAPMAAGSSSVMSVIMTQQPTTTAVTTMTTHTRSKSEMDVDGGAAAVGCYCHGEKRQPADEDIADAPDTKRGRK